MIATGSIILTHSNGWACAKECTYGLEFDPMPDKTVKATTVFNIKGLFNCVGDAKGTVSGAFKGDDGSAFAFDGEMQGKTRLIVKGATHNNIQSIIKKIKLWQENYKVS